MGWCNATEIFDAACRGILGDRQKITQGATKALGIIIDNLEDHDWDCQQDSEYWDHPIVQQLFKDRHPEWFEGEGENE